MTNKDISFWLELELVFACLTKEVFIFIFYPGLSVPFLSYPTNLFRRTALPMTNLIK